VEAITFLEQGREKDGTAFARGYENLLQRYRYRLAAVTPIDGGEEGKGPPMLDGAGRRWMLEIARDAVEVERRALIRMRDEGRIGDEVQRRLERELDLTEARQKIVMR